MGNKARVLGCLRNITNEILCNCAYHDKNIEEQFKKLSTLKVPKEEMEIITDAWELKNNMGKSLLHDLKELIDYVKSSNNS
jgi:glycine cleavage system protein P-like pyridoxal-binding family